MTRLEFTKEQREKYPETPFIHPSVEIPDWVKIGKNATIRKNCTIGTQGFDFEKDSDGKYLHIPHAGGVVIGDDVEIHEGTNVDRGTVDDTVIGKGTKIDCHCHIGHNSKTGKNCLIIAGTVVGGSAIIGDDCYIGINASIKDHVTIAKGVYIGQHTNVVKDIEEEGIVVVGNPARKLRKRRWDIDK